MDIKKEFVKQSILDDKDICWHCGADCDFGKAFCVDCQALRDE